MASVAIQISGVLYDKYSRTSRPVVIFGDAALTGLEVGGGPIIPGEPPGIWPSPGHPAHPIAPGGPPPGIWPSPGVPTHPIVIPPDLGVMVVPKPPESPPKTPDQPVAPSAETQNYGWHPAFGWGYFAPNQAVPKGGAPAPAAAPKP